MKRILAVLLAAAVPLCAGCSTSATWKTVSSEALGDAPKEVFGDFERLQYAKRIQVDLPAKLAVADHGQKERLHDDDVTHRRIVALVDRFSQDRETWTDVASLTWDEADQAKTALDGWRAAASRHQADLVLVSARTERVKTGHNALAIFKILLLPMLFLPTEEDDLTLSVRAAVVDARNGLVYATFEDQRRTTITASAAGETKAIEDALDAAWAESIDKMAERMPMKLRSLERSTSTQ